jgi:hypothetical protein
MQDEEAVDPERSRDIVLAVRGENVPSGGPGSRELVAMPRAANDHSDVLEEKAESSEPSKQGRLDVIDLEKELAVEMEQPHQVGLVLDAAGGLIRFKKWPRDGRGWRRITGHIVSLDAQGDDQSPHAPNDDVV